ncbi:hypothetical protein ACBY01_16780 [Sphingomonas sp. ac-8]|uniref:hypothetical protein n=1 Tax=Sphingomonas sp. ac-8 TaxID=3242977 RepID=UPI003A7FAAF8
MMIKLPKDFWRVVEIAKRKLADNAIREVSPTDGSVVTAMPFADLQEGSPWPDFIEADFACTRCGESFHLRCETYHGSGGRWWCGIAG